MSTVKISLGARSYPILIAPGLIADPSTWTGVPRATAAMVVTNPTVDGLYGAQLVRALRAQHKVVHVVRLPDGEEHKTWEALNLIFDALLGNACDRKTVVYALGGGVVGDMAGFAATCYMRGIACVQVPTTLLAQVDSSVGGKTAVNHPLGKNMIGAFHQPALVVCDLATLQTLPARELSAGLAEVIKYGPIADMAFFEWIESNIDRLLARDLSVLAHAVQRSCEIKAGVVGVDERDEGLRAVLNFGHTFGHAIEAGLGFGKWLHGEAVGCGMVMGAHLSAMLGLVDRALVERLTRLVERAALPVRGPALGVDRYLELMRLDKKAEGGEMRFVVLAGPGSARVQSVPDAMVREVIGLCT